MFEIDKVKFGAFVARLRKEKGMTQKELAERLFISDKAVSKWETGVSIPDVTLLIPLAELLGVTVTELLECRPMEVQQPVEELVKKAVSYSGEEGVPSMSLRRRVCVLLIAIAVAIGEFALIIVAEGGFHAGLNYSLICALIGGVFAAYFWVFARERLPYYFDENVISAYADGMFRMNIPGVRYNNSNWPHILWVGRLWTLFLLDGCPMIYYIGICMIGHWSGFADSVLALPVIVGLVVPLYYVAKKYE